MTRRFTLLATLACGAALGGSAAGTWVTARSWTPLEERAITVTGLDAEPVLGATALLLVAAGVALAMAGRTAARLTGVAIGGAALLSGVAALAVALDPVAPAESAAQAGLGVAAVEGAAPTALPWLALVVAGVTLVVGVSAVVSAGTWSSGAARASRYRRQSVTDAATGSAAEPAGGDVAAWDALTRGEDPT